MNGDKTVTTKRDKRERLIASAYRNGSRDALDAAADLFPTTDGIRIFTKDAARAIRELEEKL